MQRERNPLSCILVALLCCLLGGLVRSEDDPPPKEPEEGAKPAQPAAREPEFKKDSAKADFEKGKSLYSEGKHKEAEALFKKVKADAKEKEDKDAVEVWVQAAGGAQLVEKVKQRVKQHQLHQAYQEAEAYARKYKGTPAEAEFKKLLDEIGSEIFVVIEGFDNQSVEFTEKFGKTFVSDPKLLLDGTNCLRWTNTPDRKAGALRVKDAPTDWSPFEAVEFWVNITAAPGTPEAVIASGDPAAAAKKKASKKKAKGADALTDFMLAPVKLPSATGQWQKVRIPLSDFKAQGDAKLTFVQQFRLQVAAGRAFDFLIDRITLVKKDTGAGGSTAPDSKKKAGGKS